MKEISPNFFVSSYYKEGSIVLRFDGTILSIINIPTNLKSRKIYVDVVDHCDNVIYSGQVLERTKVLDISLPLDGIFFLRIFFEGSTNFEASLFRRDVPIFKSKSKITFIETIVNQINKQFYKNLPNPSSNLLKRKRTYLKSFAESITSVCISNYEKFLKIHDWISRTIYYDYDLLLVDKSKWDVDPISVFNNRRSVCQGFTNLSITLLNCLGIPAIGLTCYTLEDSDNLGWANPFNLSADSSHIMTGAWDNRWILMDVTWDSNNKYHNARFEQLQNNSHKYFDVTLSFLSNTHRLISVQ